MHYYDIENATNNNSIVTKMNASINDEKTTFSVGVDTYALYG